MGVRCRDYEATIVCLLTKVKCTRIAGPAGQTAGDVYLATVSSAATGDMYMTTVSSALALQAQQDRLLEMCTWQLYHDMKFV